MNALAPMRDGSLTLFHKYGGISAVRRVIIDFYERVLDSDVLGPFFDHVDMPQLIDHQTKFFTMALGGPVAFSTQRLARAHARLGITHAHFDAVLLLLRETLDHAGFAPQDLDTVLCDVEGLRSTIVT
ncbi:MAG: group 1 truncated hemoglobin [Pseudomonadota bacterium]